jgi:hypothetical protein
MSRGSTRYKNLGGSSSRSAPQSSAGGSCKSAAMCLAGGREHRAGRRDRRRRHLGPESSAAAPTGRRRCPWPTGNGRRATANAVRWCQQPSLPGLGTPGREPSGAIQGSFLCKGDLPRGFQQNFQSCAGGLKREIQNHRWMVIARWSFLACTLTPNPCLHSSLCPY